MHVHLYANACGLGSVLFALNNNTTLYGIYIPYNYAARMDSFSQEILHLWWSLDHPNLVDTHHHSSISLPDYDMLSARPGEW